MRSCTVPMYEYLKKLRKVAGYPKSEVAGWLIISPSAYAHYETDRYPSINDHYLSLLEEGYQLKQGILKQLPCVKNPWLLSCKKYLTPAENLAAFIYFFNDPVHFELYRHLSYQEKWLIYYYSRLSNKSLMLSLMSAEPELSALFFSDTVISCPLSSIAQDPL